MTHSAGERAVRAAADECAVFTRQDRFSGLACTQVRNEYLDIIHRHLDPTVQPLVEALERIIETHCAVECDIDGYGCATHGADCPDKIARAALETWRGAPATPGEEG